MDDQRIYENRRDAGESLGRALGERRFDGEVIVLGLARGGVPAARHVADALGAGLNVLVVRKLGAPAQPELAAGAIASGNAVVYNDDVLSSLGLRREDLKDTLDREQRELERREAAYRGDRTPLEVAGKHVILVDDGIATGATMRVAVRALRSLDPKEIVVAAPHGASDSVAKLREAADDVVVLSTPQPYRAVAAWYRQFSQVSDDEVRDALSRGRATAAAY